jgi:hypothetical protein
MVSLILVSTIGGSAAFGSQLHNGPRLYKCGFVCHMDGDSSWVCLSVGLRHSELWHFRLTAGLHLRNRLGQELVFISLMISR